MSKPRSHESKQEGQLLSIVVVVRKSEMCQKRYTIRNVTFQLSLGPTKMVVNILLKSLLKLNLVLFGPNLGWHRYSFL